MQNHDVLHFALGTASLKRIAHRIFFLEFNGMSVYDGGRILTKIMVLGSLAFDI